MDSGATHHFTPDTRILESATPYFDTNQVTIGNGKKLSISHIGHTKLATTSTLPFLKNVLHFPSISHNLISVTELCIDNKAFIEFYPTYFLVKDQVTKKTLLQGYVDQGLYKVQPPSHFIQLSFSCAPSQPTINSYSSLSKSINKTNSIPTFNMHCVQYSDTNLWHRRLGHPNFHVVQTVMKLCNPSISLVMKHSFVIHVKLQRAIDCHFLILYLMH